MSDSTQQRALDKALRRVEELEGEVVATARRARNANEARERAQIAAGKAGQALDEAHAEIDRLKSAAANAVHHSDEELWRHRQMAFEFACHTVICVLEDGDWSLQKFEEIAAGCVNEGFSEKQLDLLPDLYRKVARRANRENPSIITEENLSLTPVVPPHRYDPQWREVARTS